MKMMGDILQTKEVPWEWFDFADPPRELRGGWSDAPEVEGGGGSRVWRVSVDGRVVPFKLLRRGNGRRLVVMLPGMGLPVASFHGVSGYLLETHDLALVDYAGLSVSGAGWPVGGVAVWTLAEAVWAVADAVGGGGEEQVSLAGNSLGGAMCLVAALRKPARVKRMLLANPACYPQALPFMYRVARVPLLGELMMSMMRAEKLVEGLEYIGYVDKGRFLPELRARNLAVMRQRQNRFRLMEMIRHLPGSQRDVTMTMHVERLKEIACPVLVSWGQQDPLLVEGSGERLARELGHGVFQGHADLAHMPHEEAPQRIGPEWARFLNA